MTDDDPETSRGIEPVVVQVGDRDLFLGDYGSADPRNHDYEFASVISLSLRECPLTTHHHPLADGPGNAFADFEAAVDDAREALQTSDGPVLVHCAAGISRSSSVLTTALAAEEGREFDDVLAELKEYRQQASPHPALRALAREYLGEEPTPAEVDARDDAGRTGQDSEAERHRSWIDRLEERTTGEKPDSVDTGESDESQQTDEERDSDDERKNTSEGEDND